MAENSQSRSARRKQKKTKKKPIWKKIVFSILLIFLILGVSGAGLAAYWIATAPDLDPAKLEDTFSSTVYDKYGEEFASLSGDEKRTKISYEDLPQELIDAVTATEDARFFEHSGIDLRRLGGAVLANISDGFGSQGASTITHQVVEKSFLPPDKKISLKVQEQWLALQLERQYSKEEILEFYLNKVFYGNRAYGVAQAAKNYFGKTDLHDLTLPEIAILAGLPQRPTAYNPFENPELTEKRMNTVLTLMVRHGKITQEEADEARNVDIPSLLVESRPDPTPYEAFLQQVDKEVREKVGDADIYSDGLKVYTTIDPKAQEYVEFLLNDSEENPITYSDDNMQAAMAVLDTKSGAIQAIGGSRNNEGGWNYAIRGGSQLGSTAKPIMSFGPAIEYNKLSTYHQVNDDAPYEIPGSSPVRNWNRSHAGWITMRHALNQSLNVPTLKILDEVGVDKAQGFAEGLGIKFHNDQMAVRDAIGGTETNVTPLQLAGAYHAFGNQGIYTEPYAVTSVEFPDGRVVDLTPESNAAMSDYTAYMVTDMLKSAVTSGTGTAASVPGVPVAGKTGTTNENRDSWFAGYSTNYTIAAWTGGYTEDGKRTSLTDTKIAQALFKNAMQKISEGIETPDFEKPDSVVEVTVEKGSNPPALPSDYTPSSDKITELFVKGTEPKQTSEKFDQLDPVSGLNAAYDEESNSIQIEWNYNSDEDISFEVSASVDGGQMQKLSSTEDMSMEISEVEPGAVYEIQVVAISGSMKSDPSTTSVTVSGEDEEENEEEDIPAVSGLTAEYIAASSIIDVNWNYDGPDASFEVSVNGQTQTVQSNGIEISGAAPGETYTINVTPIGANNSRGDSQSTTVEVPANEEANENPEENEGGEPEEEETEEETELDEDQGEDQGQEQEQEEGENQGDDQGQGQGEDQGQGQGQEEAEE
ncbi:PBP1A family penicillin-binding protein [Oceanobacillus sp. FSL K6-2867]|uniref:transglycosylase domain-containing protein n=1 Tax=Oceanobacillus sp. FSL K6-2867 TaxID=2954748 RepID=UPI0030D783EA